MDDPAAPYRYVRASGDGQITLEGSQELLGGWSVLGDLRSVGLTGKDVEGPILFRFNGGKEWGLWVDQYTKRAGYLALVTDDLSRPERFRRADLARVSYGASRKRHGSILNLSEAEYRRLLGEILHVADAGQSKGYVVMEELKETLALSIPR